MRRLRPAACGLALALSLGTGCASVPSKIPWPPVEPPPPAACAGLTARMCDVKVRFDHPFAACVAGVDVPLPDEARLFYVLPPRKPETSADGLILTGTPVGLVRGLALASAGTGGSAYDFPKVLDCAVSAEVSLDLATPSGTVRCEVPLTGWTPVARNAACARTGHPE